MHREKHLKVNTVSREAGQVSRLLFKRLTLPRLDTSRHIELATSVTSKGPKIALVEDLALVHLNQLRPSGPPSLHLVTRGFEDHAGTDTALIFST
jgi:hypothetical protein